MGVCLLNVLLKQTQDEKTAFRLMPCNLLGLALLLVLRDLPFTSNGQPSTQHEYSWAYAMEASTLLTDEVRIALAQTVCERYPSYVAQLVTSTDKSGRRVEHITSPACLEVMNKHLYFCGRYELHRSAPIHCSATALVLSATDHCMVKQYEHAFDQAVNIGPQGDVLVAGSRSKPQEPKLPVKQKCLPLKEFGECVQSLLYLSSDPEEIVKQYQSCAVGKEAGIASAAGVSRDQFVAYCTEAFGKSRKIVIKFMSNEDQWQSRWFVPTPD